MKNRRFQIGFFYLNLMPKNKFVKTYILGSYHQNLRTFETFETNLPGLGLYLHRRHKSKLREVCKIRPEFQLWHSKILKAFEGISGYWKSAVVLPLPSPLPKGAEFQNYFLYTFFSSKSLYYSKLYLDHSELLSLAVDDILIIWAKKSHALLLWLLWFFTII